MSELDSVIGRADGAQDATDGKSRATTAPQYVSDSRDYLAAYNEGYDEYREAKHCPGCDHVLMDPTSDDASYYCEGCGKPWSLDLSRELL